MKNTSEKNKGMKIPADIPDGFFDVVSNLLEFVERVDAPKDEEKS